MKMDSRATFSRLHHCLSTCSYSRPSGRSGVRKAKAVTKELTAKTFLGSIYGRYMGQSSAAAEGIPLTDAQSVHSVGGEASVGGTPASSQWPIALPTPAL
jgi:hypothetical protein